ncbi:hypothetical protein [Actinomadura opuntiae]|uniref:hypothetical protein n=1 Tax=Actinomadura sp. OS1-43 TaxID=604315 RepID=UPI00255A75FD|nr:hypothetical protein [Actinomadura sp. OS1-43]MDL4816856.1 hypothetical protein [Actinomadura sp. OS1-43]
MGHYPLADASEVMVRYWAFLAGHSSVGWKRRELAGWEARRSRRHPVRDVL